MALPVEKHCPECLLLKPAADYSVLYAATDQPRLKTYCKDCTSIKRKAYYRQHVTASKLSKQQYLNGFSVEEREEHLRKKREWQKRWCDSNRIEKQTRDRKYRADHRAERAAQAKQRRSARTDTQKRTTLENHLAWRQRNHAKLIDNRHRRRQQMQTAADSPTLMRAWIALLKLTPCEYCGGPYEALEHMIPLSRGGTHTVRNTTGSCFQCNTEKGARVFPDEWYRLTTKKP